jgi:hypothetical protein
MMHFNHVARGFLHSRGRTARPSTLNGQLNAINTTNTIAIIGNNNTISGGNAQRGLGDVGHGVGIL